MKHLRRQGGILRTAKCSAEKFEGGLICGLLQPSEEPPAGTGGAVALQQHKQLAAVRVPRPAVQQAPSTGSRLAP